MRRVSAQLTLPLTGSSGGDQTVADHHGALGSGGHIGLVGDEHDRPAAGVQLVEQREHVGARRGVEVAGGLVGQDQGRVGDERTGNGDALLLAAGELAGSMVDAVRQPDPGERFQRATFSFRGCTPA